MNEDNKRLCDRCLRTVSEGRGEFYEVRIEAVADPSPPDMNAENGLNAEELRNEIDQIVESLEDVSPQEAQDQVMRTLVMSLCNDCFSGWIDDPAGSEAVR